MNQHKVRVEQHIYKVGSRFFVEVPAGIDPVSGRRRRLMGTEDTIRQARRLRAKYVTQAEENSAPSAAARMTFRAYVEGPWLTTKHANDKIRPTTEARYMVLLTTHIYPKIGRVRLGRVSAVKLQEMFDEMSNSGLAPATVRQAHAVVSGVLRSAVLRKVLTYNPAVGVDLPQVRRRRMDDLVTPADTARLLVAAGEYSDPFRVALSIAAGCGLRRSEVCGLRWDDIDLVGNVVHVQRGLHHLHDGELVYLDPKSDTSRRQVAMPQALTVLLNAYKKAQNERRLAFGSEWAAGWVNDDVVIDNGAGQPVNPDAITHRFGRLRNRLDLNHVRLHDLRHAYVSAALVAGVPVKIVTEQAGHATAGFTMDRYGHVRDADRKVMADAVGAALDEALSPASGEQVANQRRPRRSKALPGPGAKHA